MGRTFPNILEKNSEKVRRIYFQNVSKSMSLNDVLYFKLRKKTMSITFVTFLSTEEKSEISWKTQNFLILFV